MSDTTRGLLALALVLTQLAFHGAVLYWLAFGLAHMAVPYAR